MRYLHDIIYYERVWYCLLISGEFLEVIKTFNVIFIHIYI